MNVCHFERHLQCVEDVDPTSRFRSELFRFQSFIGNAYHAKPFPIKLARQGFYHTEYNKAKCHFCGMETDFGAYRSYDVNTREVHSLQCPIVTHVNMAAGNIPLYDRVDEDTADDILNDIQSRASLSRGIAAQDVIENYQIMCASRQTKHLAPKGLLGDRFPTNRSEKRDLEDLLSENQKDLEKCLFKAGTVTCPDNRMYQLLEQRTRAFNDNLYRGLCSVFKMDLSEAGFYPSKEPGSYKCFHCGVSLRLQDGDIPWIEHARWSPYCQYTIDIFGMDKVKKVVEDTRKAARTFSGGRPLMDSEMVQAVTEVTDLPKDDLISGATQFFKDSRGRFPNAEKLVGYSEH